MGSKLVIRISIAFAALGASAFHAPALAEAQRDLEPAQIVSAQVASLSRQLNEPGVDQDTRDLAARRLLSIATAESRAAILFALKDPGNASGRLAAARALADDLPPRREYVDALFVLMDAGQPRPVLDAVTAALGNYKTSGDVNARLVMLTSAGTADTVRIAAAHALGHQAEKAGAKRLVELTQDLAPQVAAAAIESLQTLTSLQFTTAGDWDAWWRTQADRNNDQFRLDMFAARTSLLEQEARQRDDAYQELRRTVISTISGASADQLGEVLNRFLTSPRESVRVIAIGQAYELASTGDLPAAARATVRSMLNDPRREIRLQAARTVSRVNDIDAFDPIAQQVVIESDPNVRVELANALGVIGNAEAIPLLRRLLDDPSASVVQASAGALARLGPTLVQKDPTAAAELSFRLRAMLEAISKSPANDRQREMIISALVPLKQKSMASVFAQMLSSDPRESERIRKLAAAGLGAIGDPNSGALLVDVINDTIEGSPAVRLEAVNALGHVADAFFYADALYKRMDPKFESDADIRAAAWNVITQLFDKASRDQLAAWPDKPLIRGNPTRELQVFESLAAKADAAKDQKEYVLRLEQIGDTHMTLGERAVQPERDQHFAEATTNYKKALELTRAAAGFSGSVERLVGSTVRSMLRNRKYPEAAAFVGQLFQDPANQQYQVVVGPQFSDEAERLAKAGGQQDDALALIHEALAIRPALASNYGETLRALQRDIETKGQQKNQLAVPEVLQALARSSGD